MDIDITMRVGGIRYSEYSFSEAVTLANYWMREYFRDELEYAVTQASVWFIRVEKARDDGSVSAPAHMRGYLVGGG